MNLREWDVRGLSEVHWGGQGHFTRPYFGGTHDCFFRRGGTKTKVVGVWIHKRRSGALIGYEPINSRILVVRLKEKPRCISLIQVYTPTSVSQEKTIEQFYQELADTVKTVPTRDIVMVMADFNVKVGKLSSTSVTGPGRLGNSIQLGRDCLTFKDWLTLGSSTILDGCVHGHY